MPQPILIVEDDATTASIVAVILAESGYDAAIATSCTEAEIAVARSRPALLVVDYLLNGATCDELLRRTKGIPVLLMTAVAATLVPDVQLLHLGASVVLRKPFDLDQLIYLVRNLLERRAAS